MARCAPSWPYQIDGVCFTKSTISICSGSWVHFTGAALGDCAQIPRRRGPDDGAGIEFQVGRTGRWTRWRGLEPVFRRRRHRQQCDFHNMDELTRKDVRVGDNGGDIPRAGDVIPEDGESAAERRVAGAPGW